MGFEAKEKMNPRLSPEMQKIIDRSHKENREGLYDDIEIYKHLIMKILCSNQDILNTLHNKDLEEKYISKDGIINGDAYRNVNIFSFLKVPDSQSIVKNFICYEVDDIEIPRYNDHMIVKNITFRTISHEDDYKTDWGINRQDLLAAIIKTEFDWNNIFGTHIKKIYDKGRIAENGYYYREFIFESMTPNNLANKLKNGGVVYGR